MKFGLRCFTCGKGFDPTDSHAEIWCDGETVVTLCPTCTVASDLRIDIHRPRNGERPSAGQNASGGPQSGGQTDPNKDTFIWDALKRMQERADEFRYRRRGRS